MPRALSSTNCWGYGYALSRLPSATNLTCSAVPRKKPPPQNVPFCFWWMSCTYNGWALPRQINQTWHCPSLEHLGRPRDRIKGSPRPWTLSVPNTHSELENSYPAHFSHHHLRWLCLLVIGSLSLICSSRIPQRFRHGFCRGWAQYSQTRQ